MPAITRTVDLEIVECPECGSPFAVLSHFQKRRREDGGRFYCPAGHAMSYAGENERLKKELAEAINRADFYRMEKERRERELAARGEELAKAEKKARRVACRIGNGVCPCCNRSFQNLMRHMKTKHPDYKRTG